jgi:hypothetical protein
LWFDYSGAASNWRNTFALIGFGKQESFTNNSRHVLKAYNLGIASALR